MDNQDKKALVIIIFIVIGAAMLGIVFSTLNNKECANKKYIELNCNNCIKLKEID